MSLINTLCYIRDGCGNTCGIGTLYKSVLII